MPRRISTKLPLFTTLLISTALLSSCDSKSTADKACEAYNSKDLKKAMSLFAQLGREKPEDRDLAQYIFDIQEYNDNYAKYKSDLAIYEANKANPSKSNYSKGTGDWAGWLLGPTPPDSSKMLKAISSIYTFCA